MEITLSPELEKLVNEKLASGKYSSPHEVVRDGLKLLKAQDKAKQLRLNDLRAEIETGINAVRGGRLTVYNSADEMIETVISEARSDFEAGKLNER